MSRFAFCTLVSFGVLGCGAASSKTAGTAEAAAAYGTEPQQQTGDLDPELVGVWRGYWSPKGCIRTESHIFFPDGRWQWRATFPENERGVDRIARRSGRWTKRGDVLVLTETGCRELLGCRNEAGTDRSSPSACDRPRYREVQHLTPLRKELLLGECPPNKKAETLDPSYFCRSIGGRAFWRRPILEQQAGEKQPVIRAEKSGTRVSR